MYRVKSVHQQTSKDTRNLALWMALNASRIGKTKLNGYDCDFQSKFAHKIPSLTKVGFGRKYKYLLNT